jgi:hypothetical protein
MPEAVTIEIVQKQLAAATAEIAKLKARNEVFMLATLMPLEPRGDQKQVVHPHSELGYFDAEHEAKKSKHANTLKVITVKKAE